MPVGHPSMQGSPGPARGMEVSGLIRTFVPSLECLTLAPTFLEFLPRRHKRERFYFYLYLLLPEEPRGVVLPLRGEG